MLIGLSGGSDSVALTRVLLDLSEHGEFSIAGLAHLNHGLRPSADRDEAFCREFAAHLALSIVIDRVDVRSYAETQGFSIEDASRRLRYDFLERTALSAGADRIAVGHTQDDQAETFLLKLMRGAGLTGLGGIYPKRDRVIRPLLDVARADLRGHLAGIGERWIEDESNEDVDIPRNRVRHRVLPELELAAGGPTRPAIARAAAVIREDGQWLDELSRQHLAAAAVETDNGLELDLDKLREAPPPVRRRMLLDAMRGLAGGREVGLEHVEAVLALIDGSQGGVDVPGSRAEIRRGKLFLVQQKRP